MPGNAADRAAGEFDEQRARVFGRRKRLRSIYVQATWRLPMLPRKATSKLEGRALSRPCSTFGLTNEAMRLGRHGGRPSTTQREKFHHNVYVILLDDAVLKHPSVLQLNRKRDPAKPCVYVGMTGLPVEHRFENHKHGYKSARVVRRCWVRLMPELYAHLNPMPLEAAVEMELAKNLRAKGYTVTCGK